MQFAAAGKPPVGILFDSDLGSTIDDVLALALLYGFDGKNEARVVSLSVSTSSLTAAQFCDAIGHFYAGPVNAGFGFAARTLPVGLNTNGRPSPDTPLMSVPLAKSPSSVVQVKDTADPVAVIRNALTAQHDQNAITVLAGPATNYSNLMNLPGVKELIAQKVRFLAWTADDSNLRGDPAAARKILAEWPTPIIACGRDIGDAILFPAASIEKDFAWSAAHPVAEAYRAYQPMPYDAPTWDMAPVLYAVHPRDGYFKLSEAGSFELSGDGTLKHTPSPGGKHRLLTYDPEQKDRILKLYTELASAKPVPKQRFRPPKKAEDPPPPAKPPIGNAPERPAPLPQN